MLISNQTSRWSLLFYAFFKTMVCPVMAELNEKSTSGSFLGRNQTFIASVSSCTEMISF